MMNVRKLMPKKREEGLYNWLRCGGAGVHAIVIPVVLQGLRDSESGGEVSQRKALAARIAERVLKRSDVPASSHHSKAN